MDSLVYLVLPQLLLVLFGTLLGIWAILMRRTDLNLESGAVRLGRVGAAMFVLWLVLVTVAQRQVPVLEPGQLMYYLAGLIWLGQCYSQLRVNQRLFAVLPLLGVLTLMVVGLVMGLRPDDVARTSLLGTAAAVHVSLSLAGVGMLLGCGVYGAGHVILHHHISRRQFDAWFNRLPSLGDLDRLRRLSLTTGSALVILSLASAMAWSSARSGSTETVVSHLHPMLLLSVLLVALLLIDRFRWLSTRNLAVLCVVMSVLVLALLTVSVVEIFVGRFA